MNAPMIGAALISGACVLANFLVLAKLTDGWRRGENDPRLCKVAVALIAAPMAVSLALGWALS